MPPLLGLLAVLAAPLPREVTWELVDVVSHRTFTINDDPERLVKGGRCDAAPAGAELTLAIDHTPPAMRVAVRDTSGRDRGLVVRLVLGLTPGEWQWWQDLDTTQPLGEEPRINAVGLRELPGLPEFGEAERPDYGRYSQYPAGVVQGEGGWLALARPLEQLALVRFAATGGARPRLTAEVDLALSRQARTPGQGAFELRWYQGEGRRGLRQAVGRVLAGQEVRVTRWGGWMPFTDLAKIPHVDEFGFAYQEGAPNAAFDDALGADSFVYFHCAGEFANVPGYKRGTEPLPPYETVVAAFNQVAERSSGVPRVWDVCGVRGPDGKIAYRPEKTYGDFFCQACVDPELPYGRAMADRLLGRVTARPSPEGIDGVYYDGIATGLDYAPEHLAVADHLLLWDGRLGRAVNYNLFSSAEWARDIHDRLKGTGKLTMLNDSSVVSFTFVGPWIDVPGAELGLNLTRPQARLIRATVGRKPFCTLVKADFNQVSTNQIETYLRRCAAYGILAGFFDISPSGDHPGSSYWLHPEWFDRDRPLFRRYLPLARELAAAGWQADPAADTTGGSIERFGGQGLSYYALSTDPRDETAARPVSLRTDGPADTGALAVELLTGRIERAGGTLETPMTGDDLAVWAVGGRGEQARAAAARGADVLARLRGLIRTAERESSSLSPWAAYGAGGARLVPEARTGARALRVERADTKDMAGVNQSLRLPEEQPQPMVVSGWSKADSVSGQSDRDYAIYVDCYYRDGTALYGTVASFATGSHDWQQASATFTPTKPVATVNIYLMLRGAHTGTVWFDDISLAYATRPEVNLLKGGGFEADGASPMLMPANLPRLGAWLNDAEAAWQAATGENGLAAVGRSIDRLAELATDPALGDDRARLARDLGDLRWHADLLAAIQAGRPRPPQRASRLTALEMLSAPRGPLTGPAQYRANVGRVPSGTLVRVDSSYPGYSAMVLTDGKINPPGSDWARVAWASGEGGPHFVELRFPQPVAVRRVRLWWAKDNDVLHVSRSIVAEALENGVWKPIAGQRAAREGEATVIDLPGGAVATLRLAQPDGAGSPERPGLLWLSEIEVE